MTNTLVIVIILLHLNIFSFIAGYLLGKVGTNIGVFNSEPKPQSFFKDNLNKTKKNISIDEKKYVVQINTDNLEKKYETLGETKTSNDNISSSVNKLKNMKG